MHVNYEQTKTLIYQFNVQNAIFLTPWCFETGLEIQRSTPETLTDSWTPPPRAIAETPMATTENLMDIDIGIHTAVDMKKIITGDYFGLKLLNNLLQLSLLPLY